MFSLLSWLSLSACCLCLVSTVSWVTLRYASAASSASGWQARTVCWASVEFWLGTRVFMSASCSTPSVLCRLGNPPPAPPLSATAAHIDAPRLDFCWLSLGSLGCAAGCCGSLSGELGPAGVGVLCSAVTTPRPASGAGPEVLHGCAGSLLVCAAGPADLYTTVQHLTSSGEASSPCASTGSRACCPIEGRHNRTKEVNLSLSAHLARISEVYSASTVDGNSDAAATSSGATKAVLWPLLSGCTALSSCTLPSACSCEVGAASGLTFGSQSEFCSSCKR